MKLKKVINHNKEYFYDFQHIAITNDQKEFMESIKKKYRLCGMRQVMEKLIQCYKENTK